MDAKDKSKIDRCFAYGGLTYDASCGDFFVWMQILEHAKSNKIEHIIFVTDDQKDDWWQKSSGMVIGPRPELMSEIEKHAGVSHFHMMTSTRLAENADKHLGLEKSEEAINEIRDVQQARTEQSISEALSASLEVFAERAVWQWLKTNIVYANLLGSKFRSFDFAGETDAGEVVAIEVLLLSQLQMRRPLADWNYRIQKLIRAAVGKGVDVVHLILVLEDPMHIHRMRKFLSLLKQALKTNQITVRITLGLLIASEGEGIFTFDEISDEIIS